MENKNARPARPRLQRSERVFSESHLTSWEVFVRDSLLTLAWPDLLNVVSGCSPFQVPPGTKILPRDPTKPYPECCSYPT